MSLTGTTIAGTTLMAVIIPMVFMLIIIVGFMVNIGVMRIGAVLRLRTWRLISRT